MLVQELSPCCSAFVSIDEVGTPYCKKCYEPAPLNSSEVKEYKSISESFEIRNFKSLKRGHDFPMWTADLFEDGKKVAYLTDRGDGGEVRVEMAEALPKSGLYRRLQAAADALAPVTHYDQVLDWSVDMLLGELASEAEAFKHAATYLTFIPAGGSIGGFAHLKVGRKKVRKDDLLVDGWLSKNTDITLVLPR
ncbi:hypothetical protein K0U83_11515 [bacterium]|nr:hypothetical protein [bacterium]